MRILIVEDDRVSGDLLFKILSRYGTCDIVINGLEAIDAFLLAIDEGNPYDLISLDLMLPLFDGENVLAAIRKIESERRVNPRDKVKVIVTSALNDTDLTTQLDRLGYEEYFIKPIDSGKIIEFMDKIRF